MGSCQLVIKEACQQRYPVLSAFYWPLASLLARKIPRSCQSCFSSASPATMLLCLGGLTSRRQSLQALSQDLEALVKPLSVLILKTLIKKQEMEDQMMTLMLLLMLVLLLMMQVPLMPMPMLKLPLVLMKSCCCSSRCRELLHPCSSCLQANPCCLQTCSCCLQTSPCPCCIQACPSPCCCEASPCSCLPALC